MPAEFAHCLNLHRRHARADVTQLPTSARLRPVASGLTPSRSIGSRTRLTQKTR